MNCTILTPTNKGKSKLYDVLFEHFAEGNESKANELYSFFLSSRFKRQFGDWQNDYKNGLVENYNGRINDSFEPLLFLDEDGNRFFLDKDQNRIKFPFNTNSLIDTVESNTLMNSVNKLANDFIVEVLGFSFDKVNTNVEGVKNDLNNFLKQKLKRELSENSKKLDELDEQEDYDNPLYDRLASAEPFLEDFLKNVDELTDLVKNRIAESKIQLREKTETSLEKDDNGDIAKEEETSRDNYWSSTSAYRKINVRSNAKLALSLIPDVNSPNLILGGYNYLSFDEVYPSLLRLLSDNRTIYQNGVVVNPYDEIVRRLKTLVGKKPQFGKLLDIFLDQETYSDDLRLSIYQAFNTQRNNPLAVNVNEHTSEENVTTITYSNRDISAATSTATKTRKDWNYRFFERFIADKTKNIEDVVQPLKDVIKELIELNKLVDSYKDVDRNLNVKVEALGGTVVDHVINTYTDVFSRLFGHTLNRNAVVDMLTSDNKHVYDNARKLTSALYLELGKMIDSTKQGSVQEVYKTNDSHNRLIEGPAVFTWFAEAEAEYGNTDSNATTNTNKGKLYLHSNPSHVSSVVSMWKSNNNMLKDWFNSDIYAKSSIFARKMLQIDSNINKASLNNAIKETVNKFKIITFTDYYRKSENKQRDKKGSASDMTKKEYSIDYFNKVLLNRLDPVNGVPVKTTLMADKSTDIHIQFPFFSHAVQNINEETWDITFNKDEWNDDNNPIKLFKNHFYVEVNRMIEAKRVIEEAKENNDYNKLKQHYLYSKLEKNEDGTYDFKPGHALRSQLFPELSHDYNGGYHSTELMELADKIKEALYDGDYVSDVIGHELTDKTEYVVDNVRYNDLSELIEQFIDLTLQNRIFENLRFFREQGVFEGVDAFTIDPVTDKPVENIKKYLNIDRNIVSEYAKFNNHKTIELAMFTDFYINATLRNIEYSKLFTGDFAYYKNLDDYHKRAPSTITDGVISLARPGEESFTYAVMKSAEIASPYYDSLVDLLGEKVASRTYKKINSNDAQAYITPMRWKQLIGGITWSSAHESLYNKMMNKSKEGFTSEELQVLAQPLKGVYYWKNDSGEPLYFKYSQAVLFPLLVEGSGLEAVYDRMVDPEIGFDELLTADAVKVGSPLQTKIHNEAGDIVNLDFNVQQADSRGWKLQQELSPHGIGATDIGSQIQKNIFSFIKHHGDKPFTSSSGVTKTGSELEQDIYNFTKAKSDLGLKKVLKSLGVDENGVITNQERLYEALIDEIKSRDADPSLIEALTKRVPLDAIPQLRYKSKILISSMIDKKIVKIQTNGGAFIQMSNFGLSFTEATAKESGIKLHPSFKDLSDGKFKTFEPKIRKNKNKEGKDTIEPAGIFISGSFISEHIPNWQELSSEELFGYTNEKGVFVKGVIDNRILENIIGYRIPNQGLSSNDAMQIVGIMPDNGDTIVAYTGITAKTGSDFDIDKMFLMIPSFKRVVNRDLKKKFADFMFNRLKGSSIRETLANIKKEAELYNVDISEHETLDLRNRGFIKQEDIVNELKNLHEALIEGLLENTEDETISSLLKQAGVNEMRLIYENKEGTDGYYSNKLIETYKHILTDPEILKEVMQSIDSSFFKDVINALTPKNKSASMSLYHMEPKNEIETSFSFREGIAGVGIEANSMVDVNRKGEIKSTIETSASLSLFLHEFNTDGETILFDKEFSRPLEVSEIIDFAKKIGIKDIDTFVEEVKNVKTMASFVAILNGFVDIAKDSYITQGGWGTASTNFGNTLLRMGMNPLKVITLMMQPAIRYRFTKGFDYKEELMKLIKERGVEKEEDLTSLSEDVFNLDTLVDDINGNSKGLLSRQIVIDAFADTISKITKDLKINIEVSRLDTDGSNGDISNMHVINNKIEELKKSQYITGIDSKFENTVLSVFKNNLDEMFKVTQSNPHLFPESSKYHLAVVDYISKLLSGKPVLSTDVLNEINSSLYAAKMQKFFDLDYAKTVNLLKNFPEEFNKFKDLHKEDYLILKELSVKTAVSQNLKNVNALINLNSRVRTGVEKAKITNSWGDLYKKHPEFAEKLAKYAYASTNFKFTPTQFYEYIPSSYYISKDITKFVKEYNHKNISIIGVLNDLVKGSVETSKLVPYVAKKSMKVFKGVGMVNVNALTSDRPHIIKGSNNTLLFVDTFGEIRKTKDGMFAPFYKIDQITKTLDGVNISVFEEFAPNSEELNNALVNYFSNNDTGITGSLLKQSSFTPQELGELGSLFYGFKKNITENFSRKSILEEYRNKLNTKMSAAEVNILLSSLYYSDLSIAEIKQELENCI